MPGGPQFGSASLASRDAQHGLALGVVTLSAPRLQAWKSAARRHAAAACARRTRALAGSRLGRNGVSLIGMGFFESIPQPPPPEPAQRHRPVWMRSDAVIPGLVPAEVMIVRTDQAAVAIGGIHAYPNGFEFTVHARLRQEADPEPRRGGLFNRHGHMTPTPGEGLRLGIMYADGRRAATPGGHPRPGDADSGRLTLFENGGGGSSRTWDGNFWVHPLPPDGPVTFVVSWAEQGVAEARAELDGAAIGAAAARAVTLWPEEPEAEPGDSYAWRSQVVSKPDATSAGAEPDQSGAADGDATP